MSNLTVIPPKALISGERVNLTKDNPTLSEVRIGLGWDVNKKVGDDYDLDAFAILLGPNDKLATQYTDKGRVYFGSCFAKGPAQSANVIFKDKTPAQKQQLISQYLSAGQFIMTTGDNLTGVGAGDDEVIVVDLKQIPDDIDKIVFFINIYKADERNQNFGKVNNAYCRVVDPITNQEHRFDLTENFSAFNAVMMGALYRHNGEIKFMAMGEGKNGDINDIALQFS